MPQTLLTSAARTASDVLVLTQDFSRARAARFLFTVTAAAAAAGDKLDLFLQSSMDGGTTWDDFARFTQVLGNGGPKQFVAIWRANETPSSPLHVPQDGAMAAGVVQGPLGGAWRVKWVITDAGAHAQSFTFKLEGEINLKAGY